MTKNITFWEEVMLNNIKANRALAFRKVWGSADIQIQVVEMDQK